MGQSYVTKRSNRLSCNTEYWYLVLLLLYSYTIRYVCSTEHHVSYTENSIIHLDPTVKILRAPFLV